MSIRKQLEEEIARRSYSEYCLYVHHGTWYLGKHLKLICDNIEALIYRHIKQNILIISLPPQHGKSQCVTETLPSYYLGKFPSRRVIEVSYGDDLAQRFGRRNKEKIQEFGKELFDIELSKTSDTDFEIKDYKGSMISKGIMAGLTGNPGDLIIIDDPIKNRQEAESKTYRNRIWDEFLNSIYTRLSAKGVIILIMTRWHEYDLAGKLLEQMPDNCIEINIPLVADENDILGREKGDALFPEIGKDNAWLKEFKKVYTSQEGTMAWNALMLGRPSAAEGNMIKKYWFKFWKPKGIELPPVTVKNKDGEYINIEAEELPDYFDEQLQSWDCAFKSKEDNDFVCGGALGRREAKYFLLDLLNDHMGIIETMKNILLFTEKWPKALIKLVEDKANGTAVMEMLQTSIPGLIPIEPEGGKLARVSAISPAMEAGNFYIPHPLLFPWVNDFIEQCVSFPNAAHDDMVDMISQALNRLIYHKNDTYKPQSQHQINTPEWRAEQNLNKLLQSKRKGRNDFV